ncbi:MAG TPA: alpha/beta hydrolase, partial [Gammaproteobacteria bacterium]|nr:alpha/beta hydrolase [Gammaproteobacteria bacterium]
IDITIASQAAVISVDYSLAPESRYPIPLEDCYAAAVWLKANSSKLNLNPKKIFIAGDSAGGCLAAATTLLAYDRGQDIFAGQILLWPMLDFKMSSDSFDKNDLLSLPKSLIKFFWQQYLPHVIPENIAYLSPIYAKDYASFPLSLVATAECDVLVDEGKAFAKNLKKVGNLFDYQCYEGMVHGFIFLDRISKAAKTATDSLVRTISQFVNQLT